MKKILIIVMVLVMVLMLAAGCGNKNESNANGVADESLRGSAIALDDFEVGDATLDSINTMDDEGSFRGSARSTEGWETAVAQ